MATPKRRPAGRSRPAKPILTLHTEETGRAKPADASATVGGCKGLPIGEIELTWVVEDGAAVNYSRLGGGMAATGDLYRLRDSHALLQVLPNGKTRLISKGNHLAALIADFIKMVVVKGGKVVSELPAANHLNAMLRSEKFLGQFRSVDVVTTRPYYLDDFTLAQPGYTDGGLGQRILYLGPAPQIADSTATIDLFLDEMLFATNADRTHAVAAALTVLLHHHWPGQKPVILVSANSPAGFKDLSHAYTLFVESGKRGNAEQRGQFNFGEKQFFSLCRWAKLATTTGSVEFDDEGRHDYPRRKRPIGTRIEAVMEITRSELKELDRLLHTLLLPEGVSMSYNGECLECRKPIKEFKAVLPTQIADEEGVMRPTARTTTLRIFEPREGEQPHLYELGIPVVETEIRWHVSVGQKVPLNRDRDNVTPAYLRTLTTAVAEAMLESLDKDDANGWANPVLANKESSRELVHKLMDEKFGKVRASYDPSDLEANHTGAIKHGGTIVPSRGLDKEQWDNAREKGAIVPAGKLWPTPKPYSTDPNAPVAQYVPRKEWTPGMVNFHDYVCWLAEELVGVTQLTVRFPRQINAMACYGKQAESEAVIDFNFNSLGRAWFDKIGVVQDELVIHEFAHHHSVSHYSDKFHEACCELGAKLKQLAMTEPAKMTAFVTDRQA